MIYSGEFADINNKIYKVTITTESGSQTKSVTLGGSPFVTEMDSDDKTIYSPAKYQTATVSIITPDYNFDIYSGKAQGTKVELTDEEFNYLNDYAKIKKFYKTINEYDKHILMNIPFYDDETEEYYYIVSYKNNFYRTSNDDLKDNVLESLTSDKDDNRSVKK